MTVWLLVYLILCYMGNNEEVIDLETVDRQSTLEENMIFDGASIKFQQKGPKKG